jgi:DNA gyrase subunit B
VVVSRDDEHNTFSLAVEDRALGYPRRYELGVDFITSGEYRTLLAAYREIQGLAFPVRVKAVPSGAGDGRVDDGETPEPPGEGGAGEAPAAAAPAGRARNDGEVVLAGVDEFVEFFIAAGRKGVAINRYKGLGEMNPETLWTTTMDPGNRTLLQVRAEDHAEADQMFTTLMGDQVEPRRKFIEDNALDVRNLDV